MMHTDEDERLINAALDSLVEHFDTVQIFCTRHESNKEDGTIGFQAGRGNLYARERHVEAWIIKNDERLRNDVRNEEP